VPEFPGLELHVHFQLLTTVLLRDVSRPAAQYNTCYWCLVKSGKTPAEAQATLKVKEEVAHRL